MAQEEQFEIRDAVRHATPQVMAISGPTFSGKTYGAIMLAGGLIEPGDTIGVIDTENGRFSHYTDDPDVRKLIPQGFKVIELRPPFHPQRFIGANRALQAAGCKLIITDSGSHAWDGIGGAQDMKESDKGWKNAKLWTRRWGSCLVYSSAHQIVCLKAQDKTKIVGTGRDQQYIPLGMAPIAEKNLYFDMALAFFVEGMVDNAPATHLAVPKKWPKAMNTLFNNWQPQLLTSDVGRAIREWNNAGVKEGPVDRLRKKATSVAFDGTAAYNKFFGDLNDKLKEALVKTDHASNQAIAKKADEDAAEDDGERITRPHAPGDDVSSALESLKQEVGKDKFWLAMEAVKWGHVDSLLEIPLSDRANVLELVKKELANG